MHVPLILGFPIPPEKVPPPTDIPNTFREAAVAPASKNRVTSLRGQCKLATLCRVLDTIYQLASIS